MSKRLLITAFALLTACAADCTPGFAQDWSNWLKPAGFQTPNLNAGQYYFMSGVQLDGYSSRQLNTYTFLDKQSLTGTSSSANAYHLRIAGLYALTAKWAVASSVVYTPPQGDVDRTSWSDMQGLTNTRALDDVDHSVRLDMTFTFKPIPTVELFTQGSYSHARYDVDVETPTSSNWRKSEAFTFFLGFVTAK